MSVMSEFIQEPQVHRGTREGERVGTDQSELFIGEGVTYPPRDKVLMSLLLPTGDGETDHLMRALGKNQQLGNPKV